MANFRQHNAPTFEQRKDAYRREEERRKVIRCEHCHQTGKCDCPMNIAEFFCKCGGHWMLDFFTPTVYCDACGTVQHATT